MIETVADVPDVLVVSRVVLDEFSGTPPRVVLGGSGFWAAYGAATVVDRVAISSRVGADFASHAPLLQRLGISTAGLLVDGPATSRTRISYPRPDERHEEPVPDWAAQVAMRTMLPEVPEPLRGARAYYVFRDLHPGFWAPVLDHLATTGTPLLWEPPASICHRDLEPETLRILAATDVLSVNEEEATALLGPTSPVAAVAALRALGPTAVVLRRGGRGSVVGDGSGTWEISPATVDVADPTGGGNAYSGAFLAAWVADRDVVAAAVAATGAAASAIELTGPPIDRTVARERSTALAATVRVRQLADAAPDPLAGASR